MRIFRWSIVRTSALNADPAPYLLEIERLKAQLAERDARDPANLHEVYHPLMLRVAKILDRPIGPIVAQCGRVGDAELQVAERRIVQLENDLANHIGRADRAEGELRKAEDWLQEQYNRIDNLLAIQRSLRSKLGHAKRQIGALESCAPEPAKARRPSRR